MYPSIRDPKFFDKLNRKYKKFTIPHKPKTFKQICFPQEFAPQIPQLFLSNFISPETPYKGILIVHRPGAGKTGTGVLIAEKWKHQRKILIVTPASLKGNFREEIRSPFTKDEYLTKQERAQLAKLHYSDSAYKEIIKRSNERIDKYYKIYSYQRFITEIVNKTLNLHNTIIIIDEIQNMISEDGAFYNILYNAVQKAPESLRMVLLSATPMFDRPSEVALTINLLRPPIELPTGTEFERQFITCTSGIKPICSAKNLDMFKDMIKGYVSYYRGAPPYAFPTSTVKFVRCKMSTFQYRSYITVLNADEKKSGVSKSRRHQVFKEGQIATLPNTFFFGTRMISNIAFPNKNTDEPGFLSLEDSHLTTHLETYSTKFYKIMNKIKRAPGPVYVYSNFKEYGGIKSFIKVLEANGYGNYIEYGEGTRRFAVWSGDETIEYKEEIKKVYNQLENINGSKLRILLISPSGKEGLSLMNVCQIHLLEPYWNYSRMEQIIGRGVRYCSHKMLPKELREVKVYIYLAVHDSEDETIDEYILALALQKDKLIQQFSTAMKEAAVDCSLFKHANVYRGEPDIHCVS